MRYLGNKENIIEKIHNLLIEEGARGNRFFDFFSGTTSVAKFYKHKGYQVCSSDIMYMSYCLQKAYIENNDEPKFIRLHKELNLGESSLLFSTPLERVVGYLNSIEPVEGFIFKNYTPDGTKDLEQPRMYFSSENGAIIDSIRQKIEEWKTQELIQESEYFILLACLIETVSFYSNVAGVYAAFQKKWDPRAKKKLELRTINCINNNQENRVFYADSMSLLEQIDTDILYMDPPYNERQYFPNYHLLETIALYDNPEIKGVTGMRKTDVKKSRFCNSKTALEDLEKVASICKFKTLALSYNSEGIMPQESIISTLSKYGKVTLHQFDNLRFKSNNNGQARLKKLVDEQVYILQK